MKNAIPLFLILTFIMLSVDLYAKERRGAELIITKKGGGQLSGELIAVKPDSLLLQDPAGTDVSVEVAEIRKIRIVRKSKLGQGILFGALAGAGVGVIIGTRHPEGGTLGNLNLGPLSDFAYSTLGGILAGGAIGIAKGKDKTIQLEGMSDSEFQEAMEYLWKKARVRNFR